jgi:hypothetical protein
MPAATVPSDTAAPATTNPATASAADNPAITPHTYLVRLRHDHGTVTITVDGISTARQAVRTVLDVERAPLRAVLWVRQWPICDYCAELATRYDRGSGEDTPLCAEHAREHYGTAAEAAACTGRLGVTRLIVIAPADWQPAETEPLRPSNRRDATEHGVR